MKASKRIITFFLAIAMLVPLFSFASASSSNGFLRDTASVAVWNDYNASHGISLDDYWSYADELMAIGKVGCLDSLLDLNVLVERYDYVQHGRFDLLYEIFAHLFSGRDYVVKYDAALRVYRPYDNNAKIWFVNSRGDFPYVLCSENGGIGGEVEKARTGQWIERSKIGTDTVLWHVVGNYELELYMSQWIDIYPKIVKQETDNYYWLTVSIAARPMVLCDEFGNPYYLPKDKKTAVTTPQNYYQDTTNNYIDDSTTNNYYDYENNEYNQYDNSTNVNVQDGGSALVGSPIDINNGIINVGGQLQYIDNLTYDASTQTYYVDAHDEYTYNSTTNVYETNNYNYFVQYHINYTSITYIGQTEEYDKRYELYYQLPDGRSSADLTAEDLEQLSTVFVDVVQYARSADDSSMRGLYHFDGSTEDSSYWSYCTTFDWASGASLTYMDEGTFNGSLYLDETEHDFTIALPSTSDLASDFTIQFRYYQSYTAAPKQDSYIQLGSDTVFQFSGSQYLNGSGTLIGATSIGSWNEICIMKSSGTIHYYINGICYATVADNQAHGNIIRFYFGSTQQTYKKIDELRITKGAIYTPGEDYTPTSVPHDTNLSLVLPDGDIPIADEIMVLNKSKNNIFSSYGFADWSELSVVDGLLGTSYPYDLNYTGMFRDYFGFTETFVYDTDLVSFEQGDLGVAVNFGGTVGREFLTHGNHSFYAPVNSLFLPIYSKHATSNRGYELWNLSRDVTYTLSVVLSDGTSSSITFVYGYDKVTEVSQRIESSVSFITSVAGSIMSNSTYSHGIYLYSPVYSSVEIVYMELVEGTEPGFTVSYEQAVYSSGELKNSPVLAVRTNRPIAGYQIGGVRPSYPKTGLVYAMVENSRIISLQQYTGSAWDEVDGRIWTGERWIPYSSFDVFTLKDFYDIVGGSGDDYEYIYTESGFWAWFQRQWLQFMAKIDAIIELLGGDPDSLPGNNPDNLEDLPFWKRVKKILEDALFEITESLLDLTVKVLKFVLGVVYDLLDFFFGLLTEAVTDGIAGFFDALGDESLLQFFYIEEPLLDANGQPVLDADGNPVMVRVLGLPSGVAAVFTFISGAIMLLPDQLRFVMFFGIAASFLLAVLKLING